MANLKHWLLASRPKTLPASIAPVLVGLGAAFDYGNFANGNTSLNYPIALLTILCALFIQIITNFINEIYDFKKGADGKDRVGPQRMVAAGIISPKAMKNASSALAILTFCMGLIIVYNSDYYILLVGILSLLFAWMYTGGPYPLAYNGLGDLFVFIFFGVVAVCGTFYSQTLSLSIPTIIASCAPGFLSMNILCVNNYRDIDTDIKVGKRTLQTKIGKANSIKLYKTLMIGAFLTPIAIAAITSNPFALAPLALFPIAIKLCKTLPKLQGAELNQILAGTGKLLFLHGLLTCLGFILHRVFPIL
jgi:1,4-dihydroxy-2-naphthoate octaprenyltransferase